MVSVSESIVCLFFRKGMDLHDLEAGNCVPQPKCFSEDSRVDIDFQGF